MRQDVNANINVASDFLFGAKAIGEFLGGLPERKVWYWAERGYLPITRTGRTLTASKTALRAHVSGGRSRSDSANSSQGLPPAEARRLPGPDALDG